MFALARRFEHLPVHLFAEIDRLKREALRGGRDIIDLGVGDPDTPTPQPIIDACTRALQQPTNHRYPYQVGSERFRKSVAAFFKRRYRLDVDPLKEVLPLIGSKEGIAHFPIAFINPGDVILAPDPGYPAYVTGAALSGARYYPMPLLKDHQYRMQVETLPDEIKESARLLYFNYPNNPTTADANLDDFNRLAEFCVSNNILAAHDAAYQELYFDNAPPSFLQADQARSVGIEFHSLSKTFNMTGWRAGVAVGNADLIAGLSRIKSNVDTGLFLAIQEAAAFALDHLEELTAPLKTLYKRRRDTVLECAESMGLVAEQPNATIYVWCQTPGGMPSMDFARTLLNREGVVVTPGAGLGKASEGSFRISLCDREDRLREAMQRIARIKESI